MEGSHGTYIRQLAHDICLSLPHCNGAYLEALCRIKQGPFSLDQAIPPSGVVL